MEVPDLEQLRLAQRAKSILNGHALGMNPDGLVALAAPKNHLANAKGEEGQNANDML